MQRPLTTQYRDRIDLIHAPTKMNPSDLITVPQRHLQEQLSLLFISNYLFIYALLLVSLCRRAVRTYHGAVTGRGDALPVLTPLAAPRVGRAARTVREPEALLVCTVCERDTETNQQVRLLLWRV